VRLAVAIGALAPKLRLQSILSLQWREHVDLDAGVLTVWQHKTARRTGAPQVFPVTAPLRLILEDALARRPQATHVVTYRGRPVHSIHGGVVAALERAGLPRGRSRGITFHTLRHSAATVLVRELGLAAARHGMGHERLETTLRYTHLVADDLQTAAETLAARFPIADLVMAKRTRGGVGTMAGTSEESSGEHQGKRGASRRRQDGLDRR
jgi:integrase